MNIRRILMLVLTAAAICLVSVGEGAAEDVDLTFAGHFGGITATSAVSGDYAYIGQGEDFVVLDISNTALTVELGRIKTIDILTNRNRP